MVIICADKENNKRLLFPVPLPDAIAHVPQQFPALLGLLYRLMYNLVKREDLEYALFCRHHGYEFCKIFKNKQP